MFELFMYSKPGCVKCDSMKDFLDEQAVDYTICDIREAKHMKTLRDLKCLGLPVLICGDRIIQGFDEKAVRLFLDELDREEV